MLKVNVNELYEMGFTVRQDSIDWLEFEPNNNLPVIEFSDAEKEAVVVLATGLGLDPYEIKDALAELSITTRLSDALFSCMKK